MVTKEQIAYWITFTLSDDEQLEDVVLDGDVIFMAFKNGQRFTIKVKEG